MSREEEGPSLAEELDEEGPVPMATAVNLRYSALDFATRVAPQGKKAEDVITDAKKFHAYLCGERLPH